MDKNIYIDWLYIPLLDFWCDNALQNKKSISEYGVFLSVYVHVRQWGAWKLHLYISIA